MLKIRHHIISVLIAVAFVFVSFNFDFFKDVFNPGKVEANLLPSNNRNGHYINFAKSLQVEADIRYCMQNPDGLLVLGSSELVGADPTATMPYSFIPNHLNKQVFAIGHQGNQCMSILVQMAALGNSLYHANIALIVSPGWFADSYAYGTSTQSFLEFNNERTLTQMTQNENLPDLIREYIYAYVNRQYSKIVSPSAILNHIFFSSQTFHKNNAMQILWYPLYKMNQIVLNIRAQNKVFEIQNQVVEMANKDFPTVHESNISRNAIAWDSLIDDAFRQHQLISGNNSWGIENEYYLQHVNGERHHYTIPTLAKNTEYHDFKMLIDLFSYYETNLTVIIQPLNPYAYDNLKELKVVVDSVQDYSMQKRFPILNLFETDTTSYQKGILTDVMHLGAAGWLKIDRFLINQYWPNE